MASIKTPVLKNPTSNVKTVAFKMPTVGKISVPKISTSISAKSLRPAQIKMMK